MSICGIWQFMKLLMKLGAAFTFTGVNFDCDVLVQSYCSAKFCQHCILCLLTVLPYRCNYFDFFIIVYIFKRACMDLFMSLAIVAPSISTQMFTQKCLPSIMCTSFHSLFLTYELKLIAKGSLSSLAVSAVC